MNKKDLLITLVVGILIIAIFSIIGGEFAATMLVYYVGLFAGIFIEKLYKKDSK